MGGTNDPSNLVELTAEEHFVAHQLLVKMYPENGKLTFAAHMMTRTNGKHIRNNKEYSWLKKRRSVYVSRIQKGKKKPNYRRYAKPVDSYKFAITLQRVESVLLDFLNCKSQITHLLTPESVLEIYSILWTYHK
jgi:hypothetical protein